MSFLGSFNGTGVAYKEACVALVLAGSAFQLFVDLRQVKRLSHPAPPSHLLPILSALPESDDFQQHPSRIFSKSQAYARAKMHFGLFTSAISCVESLLVLVHIDKLWNLACTLAPKAAPIPYALSFIVLTSAIGMVTSVPASYYKTFKLEHKFGFNKSTVKTWVTDQIKSTLLSVAFGLPLMAAALSIIEWQGPKFVQYLAAFFLGVQILAVPIMPYIQRLFNKFTLLSDYPESQKLHELINGLASRLKFPLGEVYVIDGSTRSAHSNAYFLGLPGFTKQIVLYDTLLKDQSPEQVEAVLAHELGHWAHYDSLRMMVMAQANLIIALSIYSSLLFHRPLFASFNILPNVAYGAHGGVPVVVGFFIAGALLSPLDTLVSFAVNSFSRRLEFGADSFAVSLGYKDQLKSGLVSLMGKNSSIYDVDPVYSALHHSHPTLAERLTAIDGAAGLEKKEQ